METVTTGTVPTVGDERGIDLAARALSYSYEERRPVIYSRIASMWAAGWLRATIEVKLRQKVVRGQRIGTLGKTGAKAFHLHLGMKHNGIEIDGWPLLDQNREAEMLQGTNPVRVDNRRGLVLLDHTRFRSSPFVLPENVLVEFPHDLEIVPAFVVDGGVANGSVKWYGAWGETPRGREFGYIHLTTVGPLEPIEHP